MRSQTTDQQAAIREVLRAQRKADDARKRADDAAAEARAATVRAIEASGVPVSWMATELGLSRMTIHRWLRESEGAEDFG